MANNRGYDENVVYVSGRLINDLEIRETQSKTHVSNLKISNKAGKEKPEIFDIVVFGNLADFCVKNIHKGQYLHVKGNLSNQVKKLPENKNYYQMNVVANKVFIIDSNRNTTTQDTTEIDEDDQE